MFKKTILMLAAALGFSQTGVSQQVKRAPPATANQLMDRLKQRTTPIPREDLIVHTSHAHSSW